MNHRYRLRYDLSHEVGNFTKEEVAKRGGTDALIVVSCICPHDGSYSQDFWSVDGRNAGKRLSSKDIFKAWMLMGKAISGYPDLDAGRRLLARLPAEGFFESARANLEENA